MALRDSLARLFGLKTSIVPLAANEIPDRALEKDFTDASLLSTYRDDVWPYACVRILAEHGSQPPLRLGLVNGKGEWEAVPADHPVQSLLDRPNLQMTGREFRHLLITYLELVGHAPIDVVRPTRGPSQVVRVNRPGFELWTVNPSFWRIYVKRDASIGGYLWMRESGSAVDVRWTPEQMTYLRWPNPNDRWYGQGRIAAARQTVMAEEYAAIRDKKFEKNLGVPPGILTSEMPLGETTAQELQKRWQQAVGGHTNAGKIAVLGSKTTYQAVQMSARDAQWVEQRRWRVQEISAAFGVPMVILLGMKDATFANAREATDYLWQETLQPRLDLIAEAISYRLVPLLTSEPLVARFDYSGVAALNDNQLELADRAVKLTATGSFTRNEVRAVAGFEPVKPGQGGDDYLVPNTIGAVTAEAAPTREERQAQAEAISAGQEQQEMAQERPGAPKAARTKRAEPTDREAVMEPIREGFRRDLASYFAAQRGALHPAIGKGLPADEGRSIIERVIEVLMARRFRDRLRRIAQGPIETALTLGGSEAARTMGIAASFAIPASEAALAQVTAHLERLGVGIANATVEDVRSAITSVLEANGGRAEINAALDRLFDGYQEWRLDRIARTETTAAYNLGAIGQYREAGVKLVRVVDGDADAPCAAANGATWTLEEAEGNPLSHPNCTRTWVPETAGILAAEPEVTKDGRLSVEFVLPAPAPITPASIIVSQPAVTVDTEPFAEAVREMTASVDALRHQKPPRIRRTVKRDAANRITEVVEEPMEPLTARRRAS